MIDPERIQLMLAGIICGMIMFQSIVVAPSAFTTIGRVEISLFLRKLFPRLFFFVLVLAVISAIVGLVWQSSAVSKLVPICTAVLMAICWLIIPATNQAADNGNKRLFSRLHSASVFMTLAVLFSNFLLVLS